MPCACVSHSLSEASCKVDHLYYVDFEGPMPRCCEAAPEEVTGPSSKDLWHSSLAVLCSRRGQGPKRGREISMAFFFKRRCVSPLSLGLLSLIKSPLIHTWNHWNIIHASIIWCILVVSFSYLEMRLRPRSMETCGDPSQSGSSEMCRCDVMGVKTKTGHADSPKGAAIRSLRSILCYTPSKINNVPAEETAGDI